MEHGTVCGSLLLAKVVYLRNEPTVPYEMGYASSTQHNPAVIFWQRKSIERTYFEEPRAVLSKATVLKRTTTSYNPSTLGGMCAPHRHTLFVEKSTFHDKIRKKNCSQSTTFAKIYRLPYNQRRNRKRESAYSAYSEPERPRQTLWNYDLVECSRRARYS